MVEAEPMVTPAPMMELKLVVEPEPLVETEYDPIPKLVPESAPDEVKLLYEYLDPFLPPEPDIPAFTPCFDELLPLRVIYSLPSASFARSAAVGIHHQLVESHLCRLQQLTSRRGYFHQRSMMRSSSANGWANPTS